MAGAAGCTGGTGRRSGVDLAPSQTAHVEEPPPAGDALPAGASAVAGGCGVTALYRGASPAWARSAAGPTDLVQATGTKGDVTAYLFGYPLRSGHPEDPANKILWVVRQPRDGSELTISGHLLGASAPAVSQQQPPDSSPGEIYPSIVDVPMPGCWEFTLQWHGHEDSVDLPYQ